MTVGSLFAGIGGFDLGFERAGFETLWQVEINPWCRKVLAKHFPNAERFEDVRTVGKHNLKPVDVIVGGFPCQDISNAGLRAGIEGERSGLWGEFARIIGELRPRYVLVENVAALLGRGMGRVLGDLAALGYDAEWEIVSAADVGAPHLRERVWVLAYPLLNGQRSQKSREFQAADDGKSSGTFGIGETRGCGARDLANTEHRRIPLGWGVEIAKSGSFVSGGIHRHEQSGCEKQKGPTLSDTICDGRQRKHDRRDANSEDGAPTRSEASRGSDAADASNPDDSAAARQRKHCGQVHAESESKGFEFGGSAGWWAVEPNVGRVAHGIPARVDRLRGLGNAVVPQIPELFARRIAELLKEAA